ncbi:GyrI-like domain-containing protein [Solitalea sp. MAHUQ-68]|uniref:GyrI-like domain-containing protein n=1 Tax=Solitalea agri TaxID=2953739 RepID=A0A9X2JFT0_9SPHI|nr:GyrI-like domain-containing protein [Solitalea agri]MCO4293756.1 GyrI-like domain-containing protein [Solitalea agri]
MEKLDLTKFYKTYHKATNKPELVTIEPARYISIEGKGDPSAHEFTNCLQALYSTVYTLKFAFKVKQKDFVVAKLEGLWWFDEAKFDVGSMEEAPLKVPRNEWNYRMMIRLPEFVKEEDIQLAKKNVFEKKGISLVSNVEFFQMEEGLSVQMLHLGPFNKEPETLKEMLTFMETKKLGKNGLHHEIYLSDFNKTAPEKLKTILREPVMQE